MILLSDGWCDVSDECIYDICHAASRRGFVRYQCYFPAGANDTNSRKPLSFYTVGFGQGILSSVLSFMARRITRFSSLTRMVAIAQNVQKAVPQDALAINMSSSFTEALDTVREPNVT